jgi:hypothetical protein
MTIRLLNKRHLMQAFALVGLLVGVSSPLWAGFITGQQQQVGGVSISAEGLIGATDLTAQRQLQAEMEKALQPVPGDLKSFSKLRKVSLRGLEAAIANHRANETTDLPQTMEMLAGLQQIQYIFVYPELNDIVLAGPAEGWQINPQGDVVGMTTGKPTLRLDDLMIGLRYAREGAMQCSIDPTEKGLASLRQFVAKIPSGSQPADVLGKIEETLGTQVITVGGVPEGSHFARVMVAADFRMKRLAMNFEQAEGVDLPSYLHLAQVQKGGLQNMLPRWWLAPKSAPIRTTADGMAWELRELAVECKTEDDFLNADGTRQHTGKSGSAAQRWADSFTAKYAEISKTQSIFADLRNLIDLAVVGAVIHKHNLLESAGLNAPHLMSEEVIESYDVPRRVDSKASVLRRGNGWLISASGGVQMYPEELASATEESAVLAPVRKAAMAKDMNWWWD